MSPRTKAPPVRSMPAGPLPALPVAGVSAQALLGRWPPLWWVGCHGGAGSSTLARLCGIGIAMTGHWPQPDYGWAETRVVLVCRLSATGTWYATGAVDQWLRRDVPSGTNVLGLVAIEASARRPPRIAVERLRLLGGWIPNVKRIGWVDSYLAADDPLDVGAAPDVQALRQALDSIPQTEVGRA